MQVDDAAFREWEAGRGAELRFTFCRFGHTAPNQEVRKKKKTSVKSDGGGRDGEKSESRK